MAPNLLEEPSVKVRYLPPLCQYRAVLKRIVDSVAEIGVAAHAAEAAGDFARELNAQEIAGGHAWMKHQAEFPGWNQSDFTKVVQATVQNPDGEKTLSRGRTAYWNEQEKMVVIRDPQNPDGGTAFRPKSGKSYFDLGLK